MVSFFLPPSPSPPHPSFFLVSFFFVFFLLSLFFDSCNPTPNPPQNVSEQAYGFVLFDYITGNVEGQGDRSQGS